MARIGANDRRHKRKPLGLDAALDLQNGSRLVPCRVLDISAGGARLESLLAHPPKRFVLVLAGNGSVRRTCALKWRRGGHLGVQFVPAERAPCGRDA